MTEEEIKTKLKNRGCPAFVWQNGSHGLISQWKTFVEEIEKGYCPDCLLEEYWNDLDTRELIHYVDLDSQVKDLDEKFVSMLTRRDVRIHKTNSKINDFWNFGYPKNASGYFFKQINDFINNK